MHVRVDTRVRCGDWQGQGTGVERHLSPAGRSGGHWTQMSLDLYGIMITLFTPPVIQRVVASTASCGPNC
jgi:hypothetical protein